MKQGTFLSHLLSGSTEDRQCLANAITVYCFRNTGIEKIHSGITPVSKKGDFSDVLVVDANGKKIAGNKISHISDAEMAKWNKEGANKVFTLLEESMTVEGSRSLIRRLEFALRCSVGWDLPTAEKPLSSRR